MQKKLTIILVAILITGTTSAYGYVVGLYTDTSGNVGIGTTSPSQKLSIVGPGGATVLINSTTNTGSSLTLGSGLSSGIPFKLRSTGSGDSEGANKFIITNSSNNFDFLTMAKNGSLGIGTSDPATTLHLTSGGNIAGAGGSIGFSANNGYAPMAQIKGSLTNAAGGLEAGSMAFYTRSSSTQPLTQNMIITSSGNVGIGTTSPSSTLDVRSVTSPAVSVGGTGSYNRLFAGITWNVLNGRDVGIFYSPNANTDISLSAGSGTANNLYVRGDTGNVGIGTTSPSTLLDLFKTNSGTSTQFLKLSSSGGAIGTGEYLSFYESGTETGRIGSLDNGNGVGQQGSVLTFSAYQGGAFSEKMRITGSGNVGIGTTTPQNTLDVNGTLDVKSGLNTVYKCTSPGTLPKGALTTNSTSCGASIDTGLRVP